MRFFSEFFSGIEFTADIVGRFSTCSHFPSTPSLSSTLSCQVCASSDKKTLEGLHFSRVSRRPAASFSVVQGILLRGAQVQAVPEVLQEHLTAFITLLPEQAKGLTASTEQADCQTRKCFNVSEMLCNLKKDVQCCAFYPATVSRPMSSQALRI